MPVSVAQLEAAYEAGRASGDSQYGDRTLAVTGYVGAVSDAYDGRMWVQLLPGPGDARPAAQDYPDQGIRCPMGGGGPTAPPLKAKANALTNGAKATLTCKAGTGRSVEALGQTVWIATLYDCWL